MKNQPPASPVVLAGFCAFLNLYVTQPVLPLLSHDFHVRTIESSLTITAATFGVAIAAPIAGRIADRFGRKHVIVGSAAVLAITTLLAASSGTLYWLIVWRFLQGLATPGVFAVTVAYINDEWPVARAASAIGAYVSGTVVGGFTGRILAGFIGEYFGWRWIFVIVGALTGAIAAALGVRLPAEKHFSRPLHGVRKNEPILDHLRNRRLQAAYVGGFCVLFSLVALFTWVTFHLAAPPFSLKPGLLGSIFCVYLVGAAVTPAAGGSIDRYGHRAAMLTASAMASAGALICLVPNLWVIIAGLALSSSGVFIAQAAAASFIGTATDHNRALAVGLYVTFYYAGGSFGATAPGWLWESYGWPGCVVLIIGVQAVLAAIAWFAWPPLAIKR